MSEQEKKVVEKLKDAIPKMNDFQKGYVLGMVEGSAKSRKAKKTIRKEKCSENFKRNVQHVKEY